MQGQYDMSDVLDSRKRGQVDVPLGVAETVKAR